MEVSTVYMPTVRKYVENSGRRGTDHIVNWARLVPTPLSWTNIRVDKIFTLFTLKKLVTSF